MSRFLRIVFLLIAITTGAAHAQYKQITGTVRGADGVSIPGASVIVIGTRIGASTDENGKFSLSASAGQNLRATAVGYISSTKVITSASSYSFVLQSDSKSLNEVVVTGAGLRVQKRSLGAAQTRISTEELNQAKPSNFVTGLTGKVAGLNVQNVGSGVNPNYRLILRGMRSFTGNNEVLVVIDNVIVPNTILSNINPEDIANVEILNGASSAALYGSAASNGALIITTKKGPATGNNFEIKFANTTTLEQPSFLPKMQKQWGSGSTPDYQEYLSFENQQYGPKYDGVVRDLGRLLPDGTFQRVPYQWNNDKNEFWKNAYTNMTDLSLASSGANGSIRLGTQYLTSTGTVPGDKYNRATVNLAGTRDIGDKVKLVYSTIYTQNRGDITTATSTIYDYVLNSPGNAPIKRYADWRNDYYSNPSNYFNAFYNNPYFIADNNRGPYRNDYFVGNAELNYKPTENFDMTGRVGITTRNNSSQGYSDIYRFSDWAKAQAGSSEYKQNDILGGDSENFFYSTALLGDLIAHGQKKVGDWKIDLTGLFQYKQNQSSSLGSSVSGLLTPGIFNLSNTVSIPSTGNGRYTSRSFGLSGKLDIAFKNYLYVTLTGRNDWVSVLAPKNRSFFYPSASVSFIPTDAIEAMKGSDVLSFLKLRGTVYKAGNVNVATYNLEPIFYAGAGYPYAGRGGLTLSTQLVSDDLKPEISTGYEAGFESSWWKDRVQANFTYYWTKSADQALSTGISRATGYSSYLLNVGRSDSWGIESKLDVTLVKTQKLRVDVGANYAWTKNKAVEISPDLNRLTLGAYGSGAGSYVVEGMQWPQLMGNDYNRDPQGRIIVDPITGYPSAQSTLSTFGPAQPVHDLGLNMKVEYAGFTLSGLGEYRAGHYIYNSGGGTFDFSGAGYNTGIYDRERFIMPNSSYYDAATKTYVPNNTVSIRDGGPGYWTIAGPRTGIHKNYFTSAAAWRIREISLGYNLPKRWLAATKALKTVRVSLQGRNLALWTPKTNVYTDPEYSDGNNLNSGNAIGLTSLSQTPPSRYYGLTLSATF